MVWLSEFPLLTRPVFDVVPSHPAHSRHPLCEHAQSERRSCPPSFIFVLILFSPAWSAVVQREMCSTEL